MGEAQNQPFQLSFNPALKIEFQGSRVTSDGGLVLVRELDERLGLSNLIGRYLIDPRGTNTQFPLADLIRQSVYRRLAGYEDVNDAEHLAQDPTFRLTGSEPLWERGAVLTSRVHSFETEILASDKNLAGLVAFNRELIARVEAMDSPLRPRRGGNILTLLNSSSLRDSNFYRPGFAERRPGSRDRGGPPRPSREAQGRRGVVQYRAMRFATEDLTDRGLPLSRVMKGLPRIEEAPWTPF